MPAVEAERARARLASAGLERQQAESHLRSARRELASPLRDRRGAGRSVRAATRSAG
ncbi:MAG: hypothetical protein U1F77_13550 [Kiritimatiellia bacterium]